MLKFLAFDYMLTQFKDWHKEVAADSELFTDLSRLSVLKLLFFASAPKSENDQTDLLDLFDNFHALPYGPVESDIYNTIKGDLLPNYRVRERGITIKNSEPDYHELESDIKNRIDTEIKELKGANKNLILKSAFDLVEITHQWESWKSAFGFAQFLGKQSYEMTPDSIKKDRNKFFGS